MAAPLIPLFAVLIVTTLDTLGGFIVVTARYLTDKWLTPLREKRKAEVTKGKSWPKSRNGTIAGSRRRRKVSLSMSLFPFRDSLC